MEIKSDPAREIHRKGNVSLKRHSGYVVCVAMRKFLREREIETRELVIIRTVSHDSLRSIEGLERDDPMAYTSVIPDTGHSTQGTLYSYTNHA